MPREREPGDMLIIHDFVEAYDDRAFAELYEAVLLPSFSPDELESLDEMRRQIRGRTGIQILAAQSSSGDPVAVLNAYWYKSCRVLLLGYLAVRTDRRSEGIGTWLVEHARSHLLDRLRPVLTIAEVEDPDHFELTDAFGDPRKRLRLYSRLGGRILSMPFFQPRLQPESERVRNLMLMAFQVDQSILIRHDDGECVEPAPILDFLEQYFLETEGQSGMFIDDEYGSLIRTITGMPCVPLRSVPDSLGS